MNNTTKFTYHNNPEELAEVLKHDLLLATIDYYKYYGQGGIANKVETILSILDDLSEIVGDEKSLEINLEINIKAKEMAFNDQMPSTTHKIPPAIKLGTRYE